MPAQTNTNVSPYYDDFSPESNFHRVLFKPGYPVQARELTQSQTILQDQVERLASSFLKDGDNVVPGSFTYSNITPYVRCSSITQGATAQEFVGFKLRGVSSGVVAEVDFSAASTDEDDVTFYVTYLSSGDSTVEQKFLEGEILESDTPNNYTATVGVNEVSKPINTPPMGFGSIFAIDEGYYFVNGFVVRNDSQTITLDKYSIKPTFRVGFLVDEDFINSNEDPSLLDNSQGASNFAAPGADRLKISLILAKRDIYSADPDFITLTTINQGNIQGDPLNVNKFDWITDLLARRTYDESGDYILTEFPIKPLNYINSEYIDGIVDPDVDGLYPPPILRESNINLTFDEANSLYAINVSPGSAYVQGYNVSYINPFNVFGDKAREVGFIPKTSTQINPGYVIPVTNTSSTPDFQNNRGTTVTDAFSPIICYRNYNDGHTGNSLTKENSSTSERPLNYGNSPWTTYHVVLDSNIGSFNDKDLTERDGYYIVNIKHNSTGVTSEAILVYPEYNANDLTIGNSAVLRLLPTSPGTENPNQIIRGDQIEIGDESTNVLTSIEYSPVKTGLVFSKYFENDTLISGDNEDIFNYNSTYRMGVLDTYFFTELAIIDDPLTSDTTWQEGNFILGEVSRTTAKVEQDIKGELIVSNILGVFKNNEPIRQMINSTANNTYLTYVPSLNSTGSGLPAISASIKSLSADSLTFVVNYSSTEDLSDYISGGYVTTSSKDSARIIDSSYNSSNLELTITINQDLNLNTSDNVVISEMIYRALSADVLPDYKRGRIARRGELAKLYFDDYIGNTNKPGGGNGQGPSGRIFTDEVGLINPAAKRGLRLPPESGLNTQADANEWFYYSILSLLAGEGSSQIFISETEPVDKSFGDMWIDPLFYSVAVWDGMYWIDVVAGSENDEYNDEADNSVTQATVADYVKDRIDASEIRALARKGLIQRATEFEQEDPRLIPSNYDLSSETWVDISAVGATIRLHTHNSVGVTTGPDRQVLPDIYYDAETNSLELTEEGRNRVYDFPFFDRGTFTESSFPRVDYKLRTQNGLSGYGITFPAVIENTFKRVKSFFGETNDPTAESFTGDIATQSPSTTEVFTISNKASFSGDSGRNYLVCDNYDGDPSRELIAGDIIAVTNDNGVAETKVVFSATAPYGYGTTKAKPVIYLTTTLNANVTSKQIQRVRLRSEGELTEGNIIQLQSDVIRSLETDPNITGINYKIYKQFTLEINQGVSGVVVTTSATNETIVNDINKFSITIVGLSMPNSAPVDSELERRLIGRKLVASIQEITQQGQKVTLKLKDFTKAIYRVKVIVPVQVTNGKSRKKELFKDQTIIAKFDADNIFDPILSPATQPIISLGKADVYKIKSVTTEDDNGNEIDIMDNYYFDSGQTEDVYGISLLKRKTDTTVPTNDVKVVFDYFLHDSIVGGFFSVDSYIHDDGVPYEDIPVFIPRKTTVKRVNNNSNPPRSIELRDCVDFRPIVNMDPTNPSTAPLLDINKTTDQVTNYMGPSVGGDAFVPQMPIPLTSFEADLQFYLPKIDSLFLDKTGKIVLVSGESSTNPVPPPDLSTGIRLYDITVPAYTFDVKQLRIKKYNYRRYTMSDIYDIDRRVDRVEDLVSLSLLESSALTTEVRDSVTGLGRFKNGVIVDPFRNHSKGNVGVDQYRVSIDPKETHLRAPFFLDQINLEEKYNTNESRLVKGGYVNNNGIITCPFNTVDFISQNFATRYVNLQPYSVFTYEGNLILDPPIDTFRDINRKPDIVIEDNSIFDALSNLTTSLQQANLGTVWSEWETSTRVEGRNLGRIANTLNNIGQLRSQGNIEFEGNSGNSSAIQLTELSETVTTSRTGRRTNFNVSTSSVNNTSYGDRVVDIQLSATMRTIPVFIKAERLKPNTRYFAFFDNIDVSEWVSVDELENTYADGRPRYNGVPNSNPKGFGMPLISDSDGNINGVFLIPNGRSPVNGSKFNGRLGDVEYNTSGPTRSFATGQRSFRLTTSSINSSDMSQIDGFAQAAFTSSGVILDKQETIVSTRSAEVTTSVQILEDIRINQNTSLNAEFIPNPSPPPRPVIKDPIAQTFYVDNNYDEGVFVSDIDLFFRTKDSIQGVEVYLVSTEQGGPSAKIIPHSRVVKTTNSVLRVQCELGGLNTATLEAGVTVVGSLSGAVGVLSNDVKFESGNATDATPNVNNTVYNVVLSNYLNEFIPGENIVPQVSPPSGARFTISENEFELDRVDLISLGGNYQQDDIIEFSAPDLPGGVTAEGIIKVTDIIPDDGSDIPYATGRLGHIYEVVITNKGSGYTKPPSVSITNSKGLPSFGMGAEFSVRVVDGRTSVIMGVSTSDDATAPTKFKFLAPVYLLSNHSYAFVVKCPTSLNYTLWISKLGENIIGTNRRVSQQPNLGSIFRSSNNDVWTEDQTEDVKFNLNRCEFITETLVNVPLRNSPLPKVTLANNPISVSLAVGGQNDTESIYGLNSKVVKVSAPNHGLTSGDYVVLENVKGLLDGSSVENIGGVPVSAINGFHTVVDASINNFTILLDIDPSQLTIKTLKGGGSNVMCSVNRPYETLNLYSGVLSFKNTSMIAYNRPTNHSGVTKYNESKQYISNEENEIPIMDSHYYVDAKQVASSINEARNNSSELLNKSTSMRSRVTMITDDSDVSPVLDLTRTNMNIVRNLIDNPASSQSFGFVTTTATIRNSSLLDTLNSGDSYNFVDEFGKNRSVVISEKLSPHNIEIAGSVDTINQLKKLKSDLSVLDVTSQSNGVLSPFPYLPETSTSGSTYAKWISKQFTFDNPCDGIQIKISAVVYNNFDIKAYYSAKTIGSVDDDTLNWTPFNVSADGDGLSDNFSTIVPRSVPNLDPRQINADEWQTLVWSVQDIPRFDSLSVKLVLTSENPAKTPIIDDLRIVCTE